MNTQTMRTHIEVLGWIDIISSVIGFFLAAFIFVIMIGSGIISGDQTAIRVLTVIAVIVAGIMVVISIPGLIAGIGLLRHQAWARVLAIIIAVVSLFNFPIGTIIGIYALWVLTNEETSQILTPGSMSDNLQV